jgi:hypothetical protein
MHLIICVSASVLKVENKKKRGARIGVLDFLFAQCFAEGFLAFGAVVESYFQL